MLREALRGVQFLPGEAEVQALRRAAGGQGGDLGLRCFARGCLNYIDSLREIVAHNLQLCERAPSPPFPFRFATDKTCV